MAAGVVGYKFGFVGVISMIRKKVVRGVIVDNDGSTTDDQVIRKFLDSMTGKGLIARINECSPYPNGNNKPDALAKVIMNGKDVSVGIEITKYFTDVGPGKKSLETMASDFYGAIFGKIESRMDRATLYLYFRESVLERIWHKDNKVRMDRKKKAKLNRGIDHLTGKIAEELIMFSADSAAIADKYEISNIPTRYRVLRKVVRNLEINRNTTFYMDGQCGNLQAGSIGLAEEEIISRINAKSEQSRTHQWGSVDEKWLVIYASGEGIAQLSTFIPAHIVWDSPGLKDACKETCFDRVYFWDYSFDWIAEVYPRGLLINCPRI